MAGRFAGLPRRPSAPLSGGRSVAHQLLEFLRDEHRELVAELEHRLLDELAEVHGTCTVSDTMTIVITYCVV
ncbi:MAG: hypothetical protein IPJ34_23480 [Myxococcales bacterium]|nr:hypothetical protein [Myxococcales bacterium]